MKIVGRVHLTGEQSNGLRDGVTVDLPLAQFRTFVKKKARIGDGVWVQEPFIEFSAKKMHHDDWIIYGTSITGQRTTPRRGAPASGYRIAQLGPQAMPRRYSRATLEIMGFNGAVRCLAHVNAQVAA